MFEDEDELTDLEKFNRKRCLANIIVAEEHMSLEGNIDGETTHPWCARKHIMMAEDHMREAIEHTNREGMRRKYSDARKKLEEWLEEEGNVAELRDIRNYLREIFKDTSLPDKDTDLDSCDICERDSLQVSAEDYIKGENMEDTLDNLKNKCSIDMSSFSPENYAEKKQKELKAGSIESFIERNYAEIYEAIDRVFGLPEIKAGGQINYAVGEFLRQKFPDDKIELVEGEVKLEHEDRSLGDDSAVHQYLMINKSRYDFASDIFSTTDGEANPITEYDKPDYVLDGKREGYDTIEARELMSTLKEVVSHEQ